MKRFFSSLLSLVLLLAALAAWMRNQEDAVEGAPSPPMQGPMSRAEVLGRLSLLAHKYDVPSIFIIRNIG